MSEEETTTTNQSRLQVLVQEFEESGGNLPPAKEVKRLKSQYAKAKKAVDEAREAAKVAVQEAEAELTAAAEECIRNFGRASLQIDGAVLDPMSRGDCVYYRKRPQRAEPEVI